VVVRSSVLSKFGSSSLFRVISFASFPSGHCRVTPPAKNGSSRGPAENSTMKTKKYVRNDFAWRQRAAWLAALILLGAALAPPVWAVTVGVVNINTASAAELELLPGVGAQRAAAILAARQKRGGFKRAEDLIEVEGIGAVMLERMRSNVTLKGSTNARRVSAKPSSKEPQR
jgi:competence protein ComEA